MKFLNYTPHSIKLNDGTEFKSRGIARVSSEFTEINDGVCHVKYGKVENLPKSQKGVRYIVSAMVLSASDRDDLVAPATGHPNTVRDDKGHIISVPCFVS